MFQISFWELVVVVIVALGVLKPQDIAAMGKLCAKWISRGRHWLLTIQSELNEDTSSSDAKKNPSNQKTSASSE